MSLLVQIWQCHGVACGMVAFGSESLGQKKGGGFFWLLWMVEEGISELSAIWFEYFLPDTAYLMRNRVLV